MARCLGIVPALFLQISDHLDIGRDESDESKIQALSSIHAVGDPLFVKVRAACMLAQWIAQRLILLSFQTVHQHKQQRRIAGFS